MLKIIIMKAQYYYIKEIDVIINLEHVTSFKREQSIPNQSVPFKCCIIVGSSIYWCSDIHFYNLKALLL